MVVLLPVVLGALPHDATLGIDADVWASMGPRAQVTVCRASKQRQALAQFKVLTELIELGAHPTVAAARACDVRVLREEPSGNMALGVFDLPRLDGAVLQLPKGACFFVRCCSIKSSVLHVPLDFPQSLHRL